MAIPDYQSLMLPLLKLFYKKKQISLKAASEMLAKSLNLSEEEKNSMLPSGQRTYIYDRTVWAGSYMKHAGLLEYPKRGLTKITQLGQQIIQENPERIDNQYLKRFESFKEFYYRKSKKKESRVEKEIQQTDMTPSEALSYGIEKINESLADELLSFILQKDPAFFESLVVELLVKMGYGGSIQEAGEVIGKSGDGGIDGIIKEDKLGLDKIYVQAKRWKDGNTVGRPEIQKFVGALSGQGATKGIFITTSSFSNEAVDFVKYNKQFNIVLIDGEKLAELMIENNLGVSTTQVYEVKKIDSDYFE